MRNIFILIAVWVSPLVLLGQLSQPATTTSAGAGYGTSGNFKHFGIAGQTAASAGQISQNGYSGSYGFLTMDAAMNMPPIAQAGDDRSVDENVTIQLDGTGSFDVDGDMLSYSWVSIDGPSLANSNTATPTFIAPDVVAQKSYRFELTVSDNMQSSVPDTVIVTVQDPGWVPVVYTNSASAICLVTIDDNNASVGDLVGAYVDGENRGVAGIRIIDGQTYSIFNIQTSETETVGFRVYDESEDQVCNVAFTTQTIPGGDMGSPSAPLPIAAECGSINLATDLIPLRAGWNLVSTDVVPVDSTVTTLFSSLLPGNLEYATGFDNGASFFDPNGLLFLNTLNSFERGFGYWIKVAQDDTLRIQGDPLSDAFRKGLAANWNLVAFPPQADEAPENYFSDIISDNNLLYVTGFDGSSTFFDPNGPPFLNTLRVMRNGLGYWVKVDSAIPGPGENSMIEVREDKAYTNQYNFIGGTANLTQGDLITVQDESENLLGIIEVLDKGVLRTTPIYLSEESAALGTKIYFKHPRGTLDPGVRIYGNYDPHYVNLSFKKYNEDHSLILRCYPNPFNQNLSIDYLVAEKGLVNLEILDVQGKPVWQFEKGALLPGQYREVLPADKFLPGIYFVNIYIDKELKQTFKVTAVK